MKYGLILACAAALCHTGRAADHGPVFGYATPVNSKEEFSFDTGVFLRDGTAGMQFSSGTGVGYGVTPHLSLNAFLPANFGSGRLSESRIMAGDEWSASASWRFLHSVTSVGKRIESTATLGMVVPGPQADSGLLASLHRAPGVTGSIATGLASRSQYAWVGAGFTHFAEAAHTQGRTLFPAVRCMVIDRPSFAGGMTSGTIAVLPNSPPSTRQAYRSMVLSCPGAVRARSGLGRPY